MNVCMNWWASLCCVDPVQKLFRLEYSFPCILLFCSLQYFAQLLYLLKTATISDLLSSFLLFHWCWLRVNEIWQTARKDPGASVVKKMHFSLWSEGSDSCRFLFIFTILVRFEMQGIAFTHFHKKYI